jgi:PBP1b-binding outer membrane lipoprotein LpoB
MNKHTTPTCFVVAAALIAAGCAQAAAKQTQAPAPAGTAASAAPPASASSSGPVTQSSTAPADRKSLASVVKAMKKNAGLFTIYQDTINGSLMLGVPKP